MEFEEMLYMALASDKDIIPKAIANFLFREIIEDAHAKYNISQDDMKEMCKEAVNRAAVLERVLRDLNLTKALVLYGYSSQNWDSPDESEVDDMIQKFTESEKNLRPRRN